MPKEKLIRITTVPLSLEKLLEGQLGFMSNVYDVTAISSDKSRLEVYGEAEGVRTHHLELTRKITPITDVRAVYKLYRFLQKEQPLIVHSHTPKAGIVGMMAAYFAGVPIRLHTVAGLPLMEAKDLKRVILNSVEKLTYRFATKVYPNSKGLYDFIVSEKFTEPSKLKIIGKGSSNGIDTAYFNPELFSEEDNQKLREELNIDPNNFVYIFVGRIVKDKGINELVVAFEKLLKQKSKVTLLLLGSYELDLDPLAPETMEIINSTDAIISLGFKEDVRPYMSCSNALVFPSYREGFPNVVMQAGAMGLPAIVSNINGCNEIVTDGINGLIIPTKNEKLLYVAMKKLAENQQLYKNLKQNCRNTITSNYERKEVWEFLLTEYQQLEAKL